MMPHLPAPVLLAGLPSTGALGDDAGASLAMVLAAAWSAPSPRLAYADLGGMSLALLDSWQAFP